MTLTFGLMTGQTGTLIGEMEAQREERDVWRCWKKGNGRMRLALKHINSCVNTLIVSINSLNYCQNYYYLENWFSGNIYFCVFPISNHDRIRAA